MSGLGIRLYLDEDVIEALAGALKTQGYDVVSCAGEGNANQGFDDEWQLEYALKHQRAIVVYNVADYMRIDAQWRNLGREHYGILIAQQEWSFNEHLRRITHHLDKVTPDYQHNMVFHL